jgi:hypothetical protein
MAGVAGRSGRKPNNKTTADLKRRLMGLAIPAMALIEEHIDGAEVDKTRIDSAWRVIEHAKGRPHQAISLGNEDGTPLTIRVVYEEGPKAIGGADE